MTTPPVRLCKVDGCPNRSKARGWCQKHYRRWSKYGDPLRTTYAMDVRPTCSADDCPRTATRTGRRPGARLAALGPLCDKHAGRAADGRPLTGPERRAPGTGLLKDGYVLLLAPGHPAARSDGRVQEHRLVMERVLGRGLLPTEEVHHRNGQKDDNRPENLELWVRSQPRGQRASDLLEWAEQIVARYGPIAHRLHESYARTVPAVQ